MDAKSLELGKGLVTAQYIDSGVEALSAVQRQVRSVLAQRKAPEDGLPDSIIEHLMSQLALMDSNNFGSHVGAGEREGRVASSIVARRHFHMTHGIGRSGDLAADQPKAAGSSLMYQLTNVMALDFIRIAGVAKAEKALVVPMATGMTLSLSMRAMSVSRPPQAKYVVWCRIDQKTSLKCVAAAGFVPIVVETQRVPAGADKVPSSSSAAASSSPPPSDGSCVEEREWTSPKKTAASAASSGSEHFVAVSPKDVETALLKVGTDNTVCIMCVTSCFAPRLPDDVLALSRIAKQHNVPLLINNAYGLQSSVLTKEINSAIQHGRVDCVVQSGDKNFLVPVGGSVVFGPKKVIQQVAQIYAGRASASPIMDMFITFLSLGRSGWRRLLTSRYEILTTFHDALQQFAEAKKGEEVVIHKRNDISFGITLRTLPPDFPPTKIGAVLFRHAVSGPRVVAPSITTPKQLCGVEFFSYGMHHNESEVPMLIMACGIGMERKDIPEFFTRLEAAWPSSS